MMRKSWTKWILIAVIALALIIGVPIIINECYKTNSGYMTIWGAADALAYYGTILGALVAVATVVVTILFTYKQIQRDSYLRRENEKWFDVESVFSNALNTINLMPPLIETMDIDGIEPKEAIKQIQRYLMLTYAWIRFLLLLILQIIAKSEHCQTQWNEPEKNFAKSCRIERKSMRNYFKLMRRKMQRESLRWKNRNNSHFRFGCA